MGQHQSTAVGVQQSEQDRPPVQRADLPGMVVEEVDSSFGPESQPAVHVGAVATAERAASTGGHDAVIASTADAAAPHDDVSEEEVALWQALIHSPANESIASVTLANQSAPVGLLPSILSPPSPCSLSALLGLLLPVYVALNNYRSALVAGARSC